jgi:RF-1 domain
MSNVHMATEHGAYPFLALTDPEFLKQCVFEAYTASGPGGQKRNRTYSAVRVTHKPTGLSVTAEESRSQHENRARALRRLKILLALRLRVRPENGWSLPEELLPYFKPSVRRMNPKNERYALFCAAMLDLLYRQRGSLSQTAQALGISTGQCGPLFMITKDIMAEANIIRAHYGLRPLKHKNG